MIRAYYNEIDPYAAQWTRNLIAAGLVSPGDVDERDIRDVLPSDLHGYTRCHFFAGIAVWDYALNRAGWPDDRPVWTGSCPCQPFSAAGRQAGLSDERHLWPVWFELIRQCGPDAILGEQVEAAVRLGWLDAVFSDLEGQGYACGAVVLGAHSVGAPHIRQRLWFVADAGRERCDGQPARLRRTGQGGWFAPDNAEAAGRRDACLVGNAERIRLRGEGCGPNAGPARGMPGQDGQRQRLRPDLGTASHAGSAFGHAGSARLQGIECPQLCGPGWREEGRAAGEPSRSFWSDADWIACRDGKARPVEPGTFPLAHGAPARVGRLRAYGNAINAEAATAFIKACLEVMP